MISVLEKPIDDQKAVFFDLTDPNLTVQETIEALVVDGEDPRQAEQIVKYARGIWKRELTRTVMVDGEAIVCLVD